MWCIVHSKGIEEIQQINTDTEGHIMQTPFYVVTCAFEDQDAYPLQGIYIKYQHAIEHAQKIANSACSGDLFTIIKVYPDKVRKLLRLEGLRDY